MDAMLQGFVATNGDLVELRRGAVVRTAPAKDGQVAIVIGGGGGHHPGFAGWVGEGMADAAVGGQIFSSPSANQIYEAALAVHRGGGVILTYLNYSGDVINFGDAAERLRADGVAVGEVVIADDVASRSTTEASDGRGIAGALFVCKVLGAAAANGMTLEDAISIGKRAAERANTIGASVSGCTLPGDSEPLFEVPKGQLALGLGIHGEPGVETRSQTTPQELAELLVTAALTGAGLHSPGQRIAVLLNSLGGCSYEELYVLYHHISDLIGSRGLIQVQPTVGEYLTSLDMIGVSLSVMALDLELERLWCTASASPALTRGRTELRSSVAVARAMRRETEAGATTGEAADADEAATELVAYLQKALAAVRGQADELGRLDRVGGDGDHGRGMVLGLTAAHEAAAAACSRGARLPDCLRAAANAWADGAGGTSGALWGTALEAASHHLKAGESPTTADLIDAAEAALAAVQERGGAAVGDKTMVDAMSPWVAQLRKSVSLPPAIAWRQAAAAAERGARATSELVATKGRAKLHAGKTTGSPDPGAVSFSVVIASATASTDGQAS